MPWLRRVSRHTHLREKLICKPFKYAIKFERESGMHTFEQYRHYVNSS